MMASTGILLFESSRAGDFALCSERRRPATAAEITSAFPLPEGEMIQASQDGHGPPAPAFEREMDKLVPQHGQRNTSG